jgi:hypothetical protein
MDSILVISDSVGFSKRSVDSESIKFEIRSTKHETNSKFQFLNVQNRDGGEDLSISCFDHLNFGHSDLFRI